MEILKEYGTPPHVIAHCEAVARVAVAIGEKLNEKGYTLNLDLAQAAGLLHDLARTSPHHERVAENYLREKGYDAIADIVAVHMHYPTFSPVDEINETDLVCLGDRMCKEGDYVGVEERMDYVLAKANGDPRATKIIQRKKRELLAYSREIEERMGITMDELMEGRDEKTG